MNEGKVIDVDKQLKTFTIVNEKTQESKSFHHDYTNNIILGSDIKFNTTDMIFTFIDDIRGSVLDSVLEDFCTRNKCLHVKSDIASLLMKIAKDRSLYSNDRTIDGILKLCINVLEDDLKMSDLIQDKRVSTHKIHENKIFAFIYRNIGGKFVKLLGINKILKPKKFIQLYDSLQNPLYAIREIGYDIFTKLIDVFNYEYTEDEIQYALSARKTYEFMKNRKHTCLPLINMRRDHCFKSINHQVEVYCKYFDFLIFNDSLMHKETLDKQRLISKILFNDNMIKYVKIIYGPAGSGKTYKVSQLLNNTEGRKIALAPTGAACKRLKETLNNREVKVSTIHKFFRNPSMDKYFTFMIIDEASMVSLNQLYKLLNAMKNFNVSVHTLVFCGDPNQLKPIKRGPMFEMMIESNLFDTLKLSTVYRSDNTKSIYINQMSVIECQEDEDLEFITDEFFRIDRESTIDRLIGKMKILLHKNPDIISEFKIISPYRKSVDYINDEIRKFLFKGEDKRNRFHVGELVICTKNLYKPLNSQDANDRDVMNGEEGIVESIGMKRLGNAYHCTTYLINFKSKSGSPKRVWFADNELDSKPAMYLKTSYAITVHSSQGSEYKYVIIFVPNVDTNFRFITREMVYTAVSRAREWIEIHCDNLELYAKNKSEITHHRFIDILNEYANIKCNDRETISDSPETTTSTHTQLTFTAHSEPGEE